MDRNKVAHSINDYFINVGKLNGSGELSDEQTDLAEITSVETDEAQVIISSDSHLVAEEESLKSLNKICKAEVLRVVKEINISKSSGFENIGSFEVEELFLALLPQITPLFKLSIEKAEFPDVWKEALVIPIPKSGDLTNVKNYRPISL